jgi:hypothetical protein
MKLNRFDFSESSASSKLIFVNFEVKTEISSGFQILQVSIVV